MDLKKFKELLKKAGLSKKELANRFNISYSTVNGWGSTQSIPYWVDSWLEMYIKLQECDKLKEVIKNAVTDDEVIKD